MNRDIGRPIEEAEKLCNDGWIDKYRNHAVPHANISGRQYGRTPPAERKYAHYRCLSAVEAMSAVYRRSHGLAPPIKNGLDIDINPTLHARFKYVRSGIQNAWCSFKFRAWHVFHPPKDTGVTWE